MRVLEETGFDVSKLLNKDANIEMIFGQQREIAWHVINELPHANADSSYKKCWDDLQIPQVMDLSASTSCVTSRKDLTCGRQETAREAGFVHTLQRTLADLTANAFPILYHDHEYLPIDKPGSICSHVCSSDNNDTSNTALQSVTKNGMK
ncbi:hypothetical protein SASPL_125386 [Salvia splendens]|uniref:Uncharacterized protein n=1 Tax=Salvia splendens TaxID=180675 RepID=A0A8X8XF68_SALSN|nr:hypothetical protein SASPL_125386 [Salvia splendens]